MALSFGGSGFSAQKSIDYMSQNKSLMDSSLEKIASGKRILNGADDSGGLSVAMKLQNQINTTNSQQSTVENAKSYVEAQSTALQSAAGLLRKYKHSKTLMILQRVLMQQTLYLVHTSLNFKTSEHN